MGWVGEDSASPALHTPFPLSSPERGMFPKVASERCLHSPAQQTWTFAFDYKHVVEQKRAQLNNPELSYPANFLSQAAETTACGNYSGQPWEIRPWTDHSFVFQSCLYIFGFISLAVFPCVCLYQGLYTPIKSFSTPITPGMGRASPCTDIFHSAALHTWGCTSGH